MLKDAVRCVARSYFAIHRKVAVADRAVPELVVAFTLTVKHAARLFKQPFKLWRIISH